MFNYIPQVLLQSVYLHQTETNGLRQIEDKKKTVSRS